MMHRNHLPGGGDLASIALGDLQRQRTRAWFGLGFATRWMKATGQIGAGDYYWGCSIDYLCDPEDLVVIFMTQLMPSATFNFRGHKNIASAIGD